MVTWFVPSPPAAISNRGAVCAGESKSPLESAAVDVEPESTAGGVSLIASEASGIAVTSDAWDASVGKRPALHQFYPQLPTESTGPAR